MICSRTGCFNSAHSGRTDLNVANAGSISAVGGEIQFNAPVTNIQHGLVTVGSSLFHGGALQVTTIEGFEPTVPGQSFRDR